MNINTIISIEYTKKTFFKFHNHFNIFIHLQMQNLLSLDAKTCNYFIFMLKSIVSRVPYNIQKCEFKEL